jgi:probable phosphoglycerate mutase
MGSITRIIALRHGETRWNSIGKQQGHLDSELTETGIQQARATARRLKSFPIDFFYSSDLGRAIQTSTIISESLHLKFTTDPRLRERHLGIIQGLTMREFEEKYPNEALRFNQSEPEYKIPGGESIIDWFDRSISCIESLAQKHSGSTILVVTHGGILSGMFHKAINVPLSQKRTFSIFNLGLNIFTISEDNQWFLETWGDICHLKLSGLLAIDDF